MVNVDAGRDGISVFEAVAPGIFAGVLTLVFVVWIIYDIMQKDQGTAKMQEVAKAIRDGAKVCLSVLCVVLCVMPLGTRSLLTAECAQAFVKRQYLIIIIFIVIGFIILCAGKWTLDVACSLSSRLTADPAAVGDFVEGVHFIVGSVLSAASGIIGMAVAVQANVRTTAAARTGMDPALRVAFRSGVVMGMVTVAFVVLGNGLLYLGFESKIALSGFGLGASLIALFSRVGGGIFTKAADVGADLVGKVGSTARMHESSPLSLAASAVYGQAETEATPHSLAPRAG
jgi:K(+)-stimulated pyrophosphate-energized sodium pump